MKHIDLKKTLLGISFVAIAQIAFAQQYLFVDNFNGNADYPPTMQGWVAKNNSSPDGDNWFQGNPTTFGALTGADSTYLAANYGSVDTLGTISNWVMTPELSMVNGHIFQFYTRTASHNYADRLQVYMSTAGTGTDVGTTSTSVGTFSTLLTDINPSLATAGYPLTWTSYTVMISGVTGTNVTGRFGFRYYVTNGGSDGTNSNYVGIDSVTYYAPSVSTGIKQLNANSESISMYPNPFKNELIIHGTNGKIEIFDVLGKQAFVSEFENGKVISTGALDKGIYIARITNDKNEFIKAQRIIKD